MKILIAAIALLSALLLSPPAEAQSNCKYIVNNAVLTVAQWQYCFNHKADVAVPNSGTWAPTSPLGLGAVTLATWQKVGIQTCINAIFTMPTSSSSAVAVVLGLPFPATVAGQIGKASGLLYVAISGSQFTFIAPTGGTNPTYTPQTYLQMNALAETISFCYS